MKKHYNNPGNKQSKNTKFKANLKKIQKAVIDKSLTTKGDKTKIGIDDVLNETKNLLDAAIIDKQYLKQNQVANILDEMLDTIEPVNFREYCKLENDKNKLQKKHFYFLTKLPYQLQQMIYLLKPYLWLHYTLQLQISNLDML